MVDRSTLEARFLEHLTLIDRIIGSIARRHGLGVDEAQDFSSWIKVKLIENDYAVLQKFRGESAIGTYLTVVIAMLARDYRVQRWGRWRPSAAARRRGSLAVRLETLISRHRVSLDQAGEMLRTSGETSLSNRELAALLSELPARVPMRPIEVGAEALASIETPAASDAVGFVDLDRDRTERSLDSALRDLPTEDRVILKMRFWEGSSVADIARALGIEQKSLYRRVERLLQTLRTRLTASGMTATELHDYLDEADR